ncbi:MAG: hypothetical protein M1308_01385 [Actinobacteria bacterium]|nr:hypothetical protein [Actinomycetota bacterium]
MIKIHKYFSTNKAFFITFFIIVSCFWIFWYPGVKVATDYHLPFNAGFLGVFPWSWRSFDVADGLGEYTTFTLWSQPLLSFSEFMSSISLGSEFQAKLMGIIIIFFGVLGIWRLLSYLKINDWGKSTATVFFILNSFFLLMFDGGQFSLNLAYITLPFAVLSFMKLLEFSKWRERVKFALIILLISIFDIRIIFLLAIILGCYFIFKLFLLLDRHNVINLFENLFLSSLFTAFVLIGFHSYWIIPSLLAKTPQLPVTYSRLAQVDFLSFSSLGHSLLLQQPHWYKNVFGRISQIKFEFILIPLIVFLSPILIKKNRSIGFWLLIALLGIFFSKGSQDPLPGIYLWLFGHIPGFSLFRDPVKFYFLTALAYSVLIGFAVNAMNKLAFKNKIANRGIRIIPYLVILYLFILARPIYLGWMTGMISQPVYLNEFGQLASILKSDKNFSRVVWLPITRPLSFVSLDHPPLEASRLLDKRPFAVGTKGTYETLNFLREASFMGEIFDVAGIGYIADPYLDLRRDDMHPDNIKYYYTFITQLSERPWLSLVNNSYIPLLKTKEHQEMFFAAPNIWWVIGSDNIYNDSAKNPKLKLAKNALIFAEESQALGKRIDELPDAKIVLNNKTELDLAASFIDLSNIVFPAKNLDFKPNEAGWWKREAADLIDWRNFLREKYGIVTQDFDLGGGWAVGEGKRQFTIYNLQFTKEKILLARVMGSSRSGKLKFYQNNQIVGEVPTKINGNANVRWFEVGRLARDGEVTIKSEGDINVVNALAVLPDADLLKYRQRAKEYQDQGRIVGFDEKNTKENSADISFQQINPTKYKVSVRNLTSPVLLVFSQNFDQLWKMQNQPALPVYSLLNGFPVQKDGEYTVEFEAQKYVYPGLIISGITVLTLVFLLIKGSKSPGSEL